MGRAMEKGWPKRPSDCQLQEAQKKNSDSAITPVAEAVPVPAHLASPGSPQDKELCHRHTQLSLGQSCHRQKMSCICALRVTSFVSNSLQPCRLCPATTLHQVERILQARMLERIGQYCLPCLSRTLNVLLP